MVNIQLNSLIHVHRELEHTYIQQVKYRVWIYKYNTTHSCYLQNKIEAKPLITNAGLCVFDNLLSWEPLRVHVFNVSPLIFINTNSILPGDKVN